MGQVMRFYLYMIIDDKPRLYGSGDMLYINSLMVDYVRKHKKKPKFKVSIKKL